MTLYSMCVLCGVRSPVVLSVCSETFPNNDTKKCEQCHNECIGCCNQVIMHVCAPMSMCLPVRVYVCLVR